MLDINIWDFSILIVLTMDSLRRRIRCKEPANSFERVSCMLPIFDSWFHAWKMTLKSVFFWDGQKRRMYSNRLFRPFFDEFGCIFYLTFFISESWPEKWFFSGHVTMRQIFVTGVQMTVFWSKSNLKMLQSGKNLKRWWNWSKRISQTFGYHI